jgi:hypothetical protein
MSAIRVDGLIENLAIFLANLNVAALENTVSRLVQFAPGMEITRGMAIQKLLTKVESVFFSLS